MRMRPVLLASLVALLCASPTFAAEGLGRSAVMVIAQNDQKCPPGSECAAERRKDNRAGERGDAQRGKSGQQGQGQQGKSQQGQSQRGKSQNGGSRGKAKPKGKAAGNAVERRNERGDVDKRRPNRPASAPARDKARPPVDRGESVRKRPVDGGEQELRSRRKDEKPRRQEANPRRQEANPRSQAGEPRKQVQEPRRQVQEPRRQAQEPRRQAQEPSKQNGAARPRNQGAGQNARPRAKPEAVIPPRRENQGRRAEQKDASGEQTEAPVTPRKRAQPPVGSREASGAKTREERRSERVDRRENRRRQEPSLAPRRAGPDRTNVERQLEAQGRADEADRVGELRRKLRRQRPNAEGREGPRDNERANRRERLRDRETVERRGDRFIVRFGTQTFIQPPDVDDRLLWRARDVEVEELGNGLTRTIVYRDNGVRIVTVRDGYGELLSRVRYLPDGREIVLIDQPYREFAPEPYYYEEIPLPPLVVPIPRAEYIVETRIATPVQIEAALTAAPVEPVERAYTLDEVRRSDRIRDKMRRVDLDTITFAFGSSVIEYDQLEALDRVGEAIEEALQTDPDEVFLIEGHTDAVGSDEDNLILSDQRAEAVAVVLSEDFDIPPENLVTQGYGEDQLKLATQAPERQNRRVAVRRITPLLRGVAQQ